MSVEEIILQREDLVAPEGYEIVKRYFPTLRKIGTYGEYTLRNRPFSEIDTGLNHLPSKIIRRFVQTRTDFPIHILDYGGGAMSRAALDLSADPDFGPFVDVTNVDIMAETTSLGSNVLSIKSDLTKDELTPASADLIYSFHFINWLRIHHEDDTRALMQCARALRPGGWGILHEYHYSNYQREDPDFFNLQVELGFYDTLAFTAPFKKGLTLAKNPIDPELLKIFGV